MIRGLRSFIPPLVFLAVLVVSFGLLIPLLGFYWDDWPVIFTGRMYGPSGFVQFYEYDRPVSAWTYILTFPILGSQPANWHIFSLLLRWATTLAMWWTLIRLWPGRRTEATWAALLFSVYPVFTQQAISVAYSQHWICYLLYFLSMGAMLQAQRAGKSWFWPLTLFALLTSLLQLLTMEYFAGLELLRPFFLWFVVSEQQVKNRDRFAAMLKLWVPYLLALAGFVIWRLFFLKFPGEQANAPYLLYQFFETPVQAAVRFLQIALQDTVYLLLSVWANAYSPASLDLTNRFSLFSWVIAGLSAVFIAIFFIRPWQKPSGGESTQPGEGNWIRQVWWLGGAGIVFGMLPVWVTDRQIIVGAYSDRFGLAAMFGASLLVVGLLVTLVRLRLQRLILLSVLIGLAVGLHLRIGNDYRWTWVKQTRFYWQMYWRAPALVPGTAIFSEGELFKSMGIYSTSMAINLLYPLTEREGQLPYWFSSVGREFLHAMDEYTGGVEFNRGLRFYEFQGDTRQGIVIYYEPEEHTCLSVLTPADRLASDLPSTAALAAVNSNLGLILPEPQAELYPPVEIFGKEPEHGWCYFYQKGSLAWQMKDWKQVTSLGDEAQQQGYGPQAAGSNTALEWLPFIEGYARSLRWQEAGQLSVEVLERAPKMAPRLCATWQTLLVETGPSPDRDAAARASGCE